jgi:hypothetical protein
MPEAKYLRCTCASCGGHIEFPADGIGMTIPCPHCGCETELTLSEPEGSSAPFSRSFKWVIAGLVIIVVGIAGISGAWIMAQKLRKKSHDLPARSQSSVPPNSTLRAPSAAAYVSNNFSVSGVKIEKVPGSKVEYAVGTAKNQSGQQRFSVTIELDLFDSAGRRIGAARDYCDMVEADGEWHFRALLLQARVASARVTSIWEKP